MAKFTAQQINNGEVINLNRWASKGGWKEVAVATMSTVDYIMSDGIYFVQVRIDGTIHNFYSKGAKAYGLEYLD
jgi:hypothetical protein